MITGLFSGSILTGLVWWDVVTFGLMASLSLVLCIITTLSSSNRKMFFLFSSFYFVCLFILDLCLANYWV